MTEQTPSLSDEQIQDLLLVGNPTDEECRLIRMGWDAAIAAERAAIAKACDDAVVGFDEETEWAIGYVEDVKDIAAGIRERGRP